jgi:hypothetical protein
MSIAEDFEILPVEKPIAQDMVVKNHYLHRKAPCSKAFGLFRKITEELVGVIIYGVSASTTLRRGVCGEEEASNVYELTRLWLEDSLPRNCESFLIGYTLKKLDKEIIVSFADASRGHVGFVYQATNWFYTGLSTKFKDPKLKANPSLHHTTFAQHMTNKEINEKWGDEVIWVERPQKHRYVYFNCNRKRKKELLKKLHYKILPYPKPIHEPVKP